MRKPIFLLTLSLIAALTLSSVDEPLPTKQTHLKLMVTNGADEMLLVKFQGIWEPAGKRYRESLSLNEVVKLMGQEMSLIAQHVAEGNHNVLSGTFRIHKTPDSRDIEIVEPLK